MENISMPADHKEVIFRDRQGNRHEGVYREVLKAFVDTEHGNDPEDIMNIYPEDHVQEWEYKHKYKNPDSDFMVIL